MNYQFDLKELLLSISDVMDLADPTLMKHQQKTTYIAVKMAEIADLNYYDVERLFLAGILHDIGALTVNEKVDLHEFKDIDIRRHCALGYKLYEGVSWLKPSAAIVLNHHRPWSSFEGDIKQADNVLAQILQLADLVERMLHKDQFILLQKNSIREYVQQLSPNEIHPVVIDLYLKASQSDAFWLELDSNNLQILLNLNYS